MSIDTQKEIKLLLIFGFAHNNWNYKVINQN